MGRAKHSRQGAIQPRELAPRETLEPGPTPEGVAVIVALAPNIEEFRQGLDGNLQPKVFPDQKPATAEPASRPDEIRQVSVESVMHKPLEAGYVHPEERSNPEYRREQEARNLAAARPSWGLDGQVKIVNPSPNMGQRKVNVVW